MAEAVHRRILYAMLRRVALTTSATRMRRVWEKCSRNHHTEIRAVYDALVRLAQPWNMRYPLIDGQAFWICRWRSPRATLPNALEN